MNPAPVVPNDICHIFQVWTVAAQAIANSLPRDCQFRADILDANAVVLSLATVSLDRLQDGGKNPATIDDIVPEKAAIGIVLLDPTRTYSKVVYLADLLGQLPATAGTSCGLVSARKVQKWLRIQRNWKGSFFSTVASRKVGEVTAPL